MILFWQYWQKKEKTKLNQVKIKQVVMIITYGVLLIIGVLRFDRLLAFAGKLLQLASPLFAGIAIAFILDTPYKALQRWFREKMGLSFGFARTLAILLVYATLLGGVTLLLRFIWPQIQENAKALVQNADRYLAGLETVVNRVGRILGVETVDTASLTEWIREKGSETWEMGTGMLPGIVQVTTRLLVWGAKALISLVLSVYVMSGQKRLLSQAKRIAMAYLPLKWYNRLRKGMTVANQVFRNYVSGQLLEACILGGLCFLGMLLLKLDYAALVGVVVAVTALIPILGAWIAGGLAALLEFFVAPGKALVFLIFFVVLQQLENNLIYPRVVGSRIGLPGIWVLMGVTIFGGLFGLPGMLLGVPATTIFYILLKQDVKRRVEEESAGTPYSKMEESG
jgi:predicted PurR-regulated permease PerM